MGRSEEVRIAGTEHVLLGVEENEVDPHRPIEAGHRPGQLHEERYATGPVVGTDERAARIVPIAVGKGARVVVRPEEDPLGTVGVPDDDEVLHRHRLARFPITDLEGLLGDGRPGGPEMLDDKLPLLRHPRRTADPRPDRHDRLEVGHGTGPGKGGNRRGRLLGPAAERADRDEDDGDGAGEAGSHGGMSGDGDAARGGAGDGSAQSTARCRNPPRDIQRPATADPGCCRGRTGGRRGAAGEAIR